jgi:LmbE family N-acetylglucosaminyl deacetylase
LESLFSDSSKARVIAFGAHPDDIEVGAGGTVARLARAGANVHMVVVCVPAQVEERLAEAIKGAAILGAQSRVLFAKQSRVEDIPMHELVRAMDEVVKDTQPDLVLVHSASDLHWDHGLVNRAAISALRRTPSNLLAFTSSYELNAQSRAMGQCFVDVSQTIGSKMAAISAHITQLPKLDLEGARDLARAMGRICGVTYAEVFEVLRMRI